MSSVIKMVPAGEGFSNQESSSLNITHLEFTRENFERIIIEVLKVKKVSSDCLREINKQKKRIIELQTKIEASPLKVIR